MIGMGMVLGETVLVVNHTSHFTCSCRWQMMIFVDCSGFIRRGNERSTHSERKFLFLLGILSGHKFHTFDLPVTSIRIGIFARLL